MKPKKLFKVAKEFNVSTASIVDSLGQEGFEAANKPNFSITPEMYEALESVYREDKERSQEHVLAKEQYEERRNSNRTSRDSVNIDSLLDPIEDLKPQDDAADDFLLEPEEDSDDDQKVEVESLEPAIEPEPVEEEEEIEEVETAETSEENKIGETVEPVADKGDEEVPVPDEEEEIETEEEPEPALADQEKDNTDAETEEDVEEKEEIKIEEEPEQAVEANEAIESKEIEEAPEKEEVQKVGRRKKLTGTRVLGTMNVTKAEKKSKKKKPKAEKTTEDPETATLKKGTEEEKPKKKKIKSKRVAEDDKSETSDDKATAKKKKKRIKGRGKGKVDEADVETKMKETLAEIQGGGAKKRQKRRRQKREEMAAERDKQAEITEQDQTILEVSEFITVSDFAELLEVNPTEIITHCMNLGMVVSINQRLEAGTLELLAEEYDREIRFVEAEDLTVEIEEEEDNPEDLENRAPVVTVMGHVDHGKTSLLDYIRKTHVTAGEAGGITQHIGAYSVVLEDKRKITFLDTPGHEAFTAMRARGALVTDLVILVVAADDSVMPQTIEAINHAQAGGVSIVVAINKMDKEGANPEKIKKQLADHNVIVEEWGGKAQCAELSAETGEGIDQLLEKVLIEAELMELKANPDRKATGIVLETKVDKGKGVVANILVQKGTLKVGDPFVAGHYYGRIRAMEDILGKRLDEVGPATPAQITGFDGMPQAGDKMVVTVDEKSAKNVATQRQQIRREQNLRRVKHPTLEDVSRRMAMGAIAELNLIIKGDMDGSIEALSGSLQKLSNEEVKVKIIHTGIGAISESDVLLASASEAIIIGFQVRPSAQARKLAEREEIDIRLFSVIYDAVDAVHDALEGLLSPELNEKITSTVDVRDTFKVPGVGTIAGCYVSDGKITRNDKVRLIREGIVIYDGEITSLKRFKDDIKEVATGYECGIGIKNYNDIKVGDQIESYVVTETKRKLVNETTA
ncbi:MAG: translation initiation factor IF-2 [Balneolales bacterium]